MAFYEIIPTLMDNNETTVYDCVYTIYNDDNTVKYSGSVRVATATEQDAIDYVENTFFTDLKERNNARYMQEIKLPSCCVTQEAPQEEIILESIQEELPPDEGGEV